MGIQEDTGLFVPSISSKAGQLCRRRQLHSFSKGDAVMYTWVIYKMKLNQFCKSTPTDPNASYMWDLHMKDSDWITGSGTTYAKVALLMKHFGVEKPEELEGKSFTSERDSAGSALDLLLVQIRNGGNYTPPSHEEIRLRAATAMAKFERPDYSDVDDETVFDAFQEVWGGWHAEENWLNWLKAKIQDLSQGRVVLLEADVNDFSMRIKGPANYMMLQRGEECQLVVIGPYSHPVTFVDPAKQKS
jgi:hypothetical protein